ncbi:hypothetical protein GOP47_0028175 [Adiantum capillus-veneris]|nr:hypothetical protein GOP47_0028175 [Adiantum capillus-veneris]
MNTVDKGMGKNEPETLPHLFMNYSLWLPVFKVVPVKLNWKHVGIFSEAWSTRDPARVRDAEFQKLLRDWYIGAGLIPELPLRIVSVAKNINLKTVIHGTAEAEAGRSSLAAVAWAAGVGASDDDLMALFEAWADMYGKQYTYGRSEAEEMMRFGIFKDNLAYIEAHNHGNGSSYRLGLNEFADLTLEEFVASGYAGTPTTEVEAEAERAVEVHHHHSSVEAIPASIDWRTRGAVTPVKNQGRCGSCWAFAVVGAVEGTQAISTGKLISGSEQQLTSCAPTSTGNGCNGGPRLSTLDWVINNGLASEEDYPYFSGNAGDPGVCKDPKPPVSLQISGQVRVSANNEMALLIALADRPVAISMQSDTRDFQLYTHGIFTGEGCSPPRTGHAMVVVGYGTENGSDFWIVKNSWGANWGESGYIRVMRGISPPHGVCSILLRPDYATMKQQASFTSHENPSLAVADT